MKIVYKTGDVLRCDEILMIHGCNAQGVMGSGVAKAVAEYYPEVYIEYAERFEGGDPIPLGEVQFVPDAFMGEFIIIGNAITQQNFGPGLQVDYDAVRSCMKVVNAFCKRRGLSRVAMPKIGAGLGGGDWDIISEIIEEECTDVTPVVYIYEP